MFAGKLVGGQVFRGEVGTVLATDSLLHASSFLADRFCGSLCLRVLVVWIIIPVARPFRTSIQTQTKSMSETSIEVTIIPGVSPEDRHRIEDAFEGKGLDVAGGGGFEDGSESDIMLYSEKPAKHLPAVIRILRKANVGNDSYVTVDSAEKHEVYGDSVPMDSKPWWKFW